jgi:hypothetical protein
MAAPRFDLSCLPIVTVTFDGLATDAEFDAYLDTMSRTVLDRREMTVTILDARASGRAPASQRKKQADWLKQHEHRLRQYSLGTAFVIDSPLVRGVLTAILWVQPMATAYTIVGTLEAAERWAAEQLRAAGAAPPPAPARRSERR